MESIRNIVSANLTLLHNGLKQLHGYTPGASETLQLTLRPFRETDLDDFFGWAGDDAATRFMTWETFPNIENARQFLTTVIIPHPWFRAICINDKAVGHVLLRQGTGIHSCRAELGYAVSRNYWGIGIATEAVMRAILAGFSDLPGLRRIEAMVLPENLPSQKVLEKAGFTRECLLRRYIKIRENVRDCILYSHVLPVASSS
ncbi:hypothetical protein SUGI_0688730 [Cryptomeria japonica]|uniref:uncharacterized protein LOC131856511 n=1 Tax=Cryptomeria japonica TaxID=3369 RepID=UPI002414C20A|nr:uncharacterized protein LOC131856511 [Cryptomeria japonica]GLJ34269.1 hypothetical protein SUGI_0688730 [Cryptomeria japonica]